MTLTFHELNGTTRRIKRQNAKRLIASGLYERIGDRTYKAVERRRERRGLEVKIMPYQAETFDYDYPVQLPHPELQLIPAMRYPVDIARQGLTSYGPSF